MTRQPPLMQTPAAGLICLGIVTGTHGVRGAVRVKTFADDPLSLGTFGALRDASGKRRYVVRDIQPDKTGARLMLEHITTREQAEALKGEMLCVPRDALPVLDDTEEFYHTDLIGLKAQASNGAALGTVRAVHDFGAGDLLDIDGVFVPFTRDCVPRIDLEAGTVTIIMPESNEEADAVSDEEVGP